jgi:hypothetical protein
MPLSPVGYIVYPTDHLVRTFPGCLWSRLGSATRLDLLPAAGLEVIAGLHRVPGCLQMLTGILMKVMQLLSEVCHVAHGFLLDKEEPITHNTMLAGIISWVDAL